MTGKQTSRSSTPGRPHSASTNSCPRSPCSYFATQQFSSSSLSTFSLWIFVQSSFIHRHYSLRAVITHRIQSRYNLQGTNKTQVSMRCGPELLMPSPGVNEALAPSDSLNSVPPLFKDKAERLLVRDTKPSGNLWTSIWLIRA